MTIKNNLTNLVNARKEIIKAINNNGGICPENTKLSQIPPYIDGSNPISSSCVWSGSAATLQEIYDGIKIFTLQWNAQYGGNTSIEIPGPYISPSGKGIPKGGFYFISPYSNLIKAKISADHASFVFTSSYVLHDWLICRGKHYLSFDTTAMSNYPTADARWTYGASMFYIRAQKFNHVWWSKGLDVATTIEKDSVCIIGYSGTNKNMYRYVKILDNNNNEVAKIESTQFDSETTITTMKVMVKKGYTIVNHNGGSFALCLW